MRFVSKEIRVPIKFQRAISGVADYKCLYSDVKKEILEVLISEQKGLCAYCNQRINVACAKIEHLICQSHNKSFDLKYFNLFAVCNGNEGVLSQSHCDTYRAKSNDYFLPFVFFDKCLTKSWDDLNPFFDIDFSSRTKLVSGKITSRKIKNQGYPNNEKSVNQAIDILNLNSEILVKARKAKWENVLKENEKSKLDWPGLFDFYLNLNPATDFCEFVLLAIRKQIDDK